MCTGDHLYSSKHHGKHLFFFFHFLKLKTIFVEKQNKTSGDIHPRNIPQN